MFVHEAELWQSYTPLTHSSISITVKNSGEARVSEFCLFVYFTLFPFFFTFPFPKVRYYSWHRKVKQMTKQKVRKVVPVLGDFAVAAYAFLNRPHFFRLEDNKSQRINHLT